VRKALGVAFEGDAVEEKYMLGDIEVDWPFPCGYAVRAIHQTDGATDDLLVSIPLPGRGRSARRWSAARCATRGRVSAQIPPTWISWFAGSPNCCWSGIWS